MSSTGARQEVRTEANLFKIKVRSIRLCLSMSWKFNIVATPDQQQAPSFAQGRTKG